MSKFSAIALISSLLFACTSQESSSKISEKVSLPTGVSLVEDVVVTEERLAIPFKKFILDNGLTVILHQDNSDPLVHVDVTYHVGSAREQLGKSGFAHFFEHMMFQGSKNVADEQHFKIVTQSGGNLNGTTNTDRTNYYETVPRNQLEKMLWLESDRMGFLLETITEDKFEIQRSTVKNERGQNVDNRPYGRLNETVNQMMYPREHPYSWPVIGYMSDLDRGTVTDLKEFFSRWYGPNNAVLTIGPSIERGFYYDIDFGEENLSDKDFPKIEARMLEIARGKHDYKMRSTTKEEALEYYKSINNTYKVELIENLEDGTITFCDHSDFSDLCKGGHIPSTGIVKSVKLLNIAGAYWRGDEKNNQLTRIYGISFPKQKMLTEYLELVEKAKERDHRKLGKELNLFTFSQKVGQGLPLWLPKGTELRDRLQRFLEEAQRKAGYKKVITPHIGLKDLYVTSGHYEKYGENSFQPINTPNENETFLLKPMKSSVLFTD